MERVDRCILGVNFSRLALARSLSRPNPCARLAPLRSLVAEAAGPSPRIDSDVAPLTSADQNTIGLRKSAEFWYEHTRGSALPDDPVGLGGVREIFVPATEKLKNRAGRVFDQGTIFLSLSRAVRGGGLGKTELREEFRHRHAITEVSASAPKLVPYGIDRFLSSMFHIGAGLSAPVL
jgi:hypothetical protein